MATEAAEALSARSRTIKIVGVISLGHFFSHFYYMVLPPLFPLLKQSLNVDYTALGLCITTYSVASAVVQAPVGFLVDRVNPALVLVGGLTLCSLCVIGMGLFPNYIALLVLMALLGLGDSVFHPADYSIMSQTIRTDMMGRAFSVHGFAGHLGFASGPAVILTAAALWDWRVALVLSGLCGLVVAMVLFLSRRLLLAPRTTPTNVYAERVSTRDGVRVLFSTPLLLGLLFFTMLALTGTGIRDFGISALHIMYDTSLEKAGTVIATFLFASPLGVLLGGWVADKYTHHHRVAIICIGVVAVSCTWLVVSSPSLTVLAIVFGFAGLCLGTMAPARDLLVVRLTPQGHVGKAFGFVSIGLGIGGMVGPITFGLLLDNAHASSVFTVSAGFALATVACLLGIGRVLRPPSPLPH